MMTDQFTIHIQYIVKQTAIQVVKSSHSQTEVKINFIRIIY